MADLILEKLNSFVKALLVVHRRILGFLLLLQAMLIGRNVLGEGLMGNFKISEKQYSHPFG